MIVKRKWSWKSPVRSTGGSTAHSVPGRGVWVWISWEPDPKSLLSSERSRAQQSCPAWHRLGRQGQTCPGQPLPQPAGHDHPCDCHWLLAASWDGDPAGSREHWKWDKREMFSSKQTVLQFPQSVTAVLCAGLAGHSVLAALRLPGAWSGTPAQTQCLPHRAQHSEECTKISERNAEQAFVSESSVLF